MNKIKKIYFAPGLGEKPQNYKTFSKHMTLLDVDWNTGKYTPKITKPDVIISFSLGLCFTFDYALKHHVDTLVFCSPTPGVETLKGIKTDKIICTVGEKETWVLQDFKRLLKTTDIPSEIIIVPSADHKITGEYKKKLLELVQELKG